MTRTTGAERLDRMERIGSALLLVGMVLQSFGVAWDVQWHDNVGPDTFFTLPHMLIYLGPSLAGLTSMVVVLLRTDAHRRHPEAPEPPTLEVTVLRVFRAPAGFLVAGVGGATELIYGVADLWWHSEYGFDATLDSPPHVGLALGGVGICVGTIMAFAGQRRHRRGRIGLVVSVAVTMATVIFAMFWTQPIEIAVTAVSTLLLVLVACVLRRSGWLALTGLAFAVLQGLQWLFVPWATSVYAASLGLPFRDNVPTAPKMPGLYPMVLPMIALVVEAGMALCRQRGWRPALVVPGIGAIAAGLMMVGYEPQVGYLFSLPLTLVAIPIGLAMGWLGWRLSFPVRRLGPSLAVAHVVAAAVGAPAVEV